MRTTTFAKSISIRPCRRANQELLEDVLRVVALSFTYQEDTEYITQYFRQNGKRDYEPLLYRKLGEIYLDNERVFDGANLFLGYSSEYPFSPHSPYFHQRAIETYQQAGYSDLVLEQKIAFVNSYDVTPSTGRYKIRKHSRR